MSKQELIRLYAEGKLARRDFVRRLTLAGVSAGAAVGYATSLAPSASAAVRPLAVQQDDEYGGPVDPDDIDEAIDATITLLNGLVDFVQSAINFFSPEDFVEFLNGGTLDTIAQLTNLLAQLREEQSALAAATGSSALVSAGSTKRQLAMTARLQAGQTPDQFLADLGDVLDTQCRLYATINPLIDDATLRQWTASVGVNKGAQAAYVRLLRGLDPFPAYLEAPISLEEAQEIIGPILSE